MIEGNIPGDKPETIKEDSLEQTAEKLKGVDLSKLTPEQFQKLKRRVEDIEAIIVGLVGLKMMDWGGAISSHAHMHQFVPNSNFMERIDNLKGLFEGLAGASMSLVGLAATAMTILYFFAQIKDLEIVQRKYNEFKEHEGLT